MANETGSLAPAAVYEPPKRRQSFRVPVWVWILLLVAGTLAGFLAGRSMHSRGPAAAKMLAGHTSISENELDGIVATYDYDGASYTVTAREAIAHESSLSALRNSDGSYAMPSAESVLSAARTAVLMRDVEAHGITVSDEELLAYAKDTFGTDDIASLANTYTMDEESVRERMRESCALAKLRSEVLQAPETEPVEPAKPADGNEDEPTADYAAYIIALAGKEWNSEKGTWAADDGTFAVALKEYDVRNDSATYAAAQTAYNVAFQLYSDQITGSSTGWTAYVNKLLCDAELTLSTMVM